MRYTVELRTRRTTGPVLATTATERYTVGTLADLDALRDRLELIHADAIASGAVEVCVSAADERGPVWDIITTGPFHWGPVTS